jgi:hypothetical protein
MKPEEKKKLKAVLSALLKVKPVPRKAKKKSPIKKP